MLANTYGRAHMIPLTPLKAGYLAVGAAIGRNELNMLVDCAAPVTHLDPQRTAQFVHWRRPTNLDGETLMSMPKALVRGFQVVGLRVGDLLVESYDCSQINKMLAVSGDAPIDGQIGDDVLTRCKGIIDFWDLKMYLCPPE